MTLPASYEETFRKFDAADGRWIFTWNWAAFWFGLFWYLYRGLWLKAIIYFVALLILSGITAGLVTLFCWVGFGALANYDLYLLRRKGTQLWNGGGVAPDAVPGVTITPTMQANSAVTRLAALDKARSQGLLSEFEYVEKRETGFDLHETLALARRRVGYRGDVVALARRSGVRRLDDLLLLLRDDTPADVDETGSF